MWLCVQSPPALVDEPEKQAEFNEYVKGRGYTLHTVPDYGGVRAPLAPRVCDCVCVCVCVRG